MNHKSTVKSLTALTMAGAMVFSINTMPVSAAKKKTTSTVKSIKVVAPSGSSKSATVAKGKSIKLAVTVDATKSKDKKVTYKVSNKKVVSVSKKGVVKGKKAGTATVKVVSANNKKKSASIKIKVVSGAVKTVKLNKSKLALNVGDSGNLTATVTASKKAYKTLKWTTSNEKVVTVTSKGVVKGIGKGTAKITAASLDGTNKKSTCTVTVSEKQAVNDGANEAVNGTVNGTGDKTENETTDKTANETANGIKSLKVYNPLNAHESRTLKVTLSSPQALTVDDFDVAVKQYAEGSYVGKLSVEDIYTTDNQTYEIYLDNDSYDNSVETGEYVRVTIKALNGQKTMETLFLTETATVRHTYTATVGGRRDQILIYNDATMGYSKSEIRSGTLPTGYKLINKVGRYSGIDGIPTVVADNQHVIIDTTDEFGRVITTDENFVIGDEDHIVVENKTVGDQVDGRIYTNNNIYETLYFAGGKGHITAEILNTYGDVFKIDSVNSDNVKISADAGKLEAGTYDVPVQISDSNGNTAQGTLKIIVNATAKIVTKVNNYNEKGKIYFYNHDTDQEILLDRMETSKEYEGEDNKILKSTGYLPYGTYSVYYRMCGNKIVLNKTLKVSGDTNLEVTLPTAKVTGTIYDVNNNEYKGGVIIYMYRIKNHELGSNSEMDYVYYSGTYSFEGVPDGQYVVVTSGYGDDDKYYEIQSGIITVSGGDATMDIKLPKANSN